jgi:hypothetical protein
MRCYVDWWSSAGLGADSQVVGLASGGGYLLQIARPRHPRARGGARPASLRSPASVG